MQEAFSTLRVVDGAEEGMVASSDLTALGGAVNDIGRESLTEVVYAELIGVAFSMKACGTQLKFSVKALGTFEIRTNSGFAANY